MNDILLTARWPVGGIRTFLKYVYADSSFADCGLVFAVPDTKEARHLSTDLASTSAEFIWLPADTFGYIRELRRVISSTEFPVVHAHGFTSILACTLGVRTTRVIATIHDVLLDSQLKGAKGALKKIALRRALTVPSCIHAVSNACASNLIEMLELPSTVRSSITVVRNGIDVHAFASASPADIRKELGLSTEALLFGFFGRFMNQKGFRYIVEAIKYLRDAGMHDVCVVCVGSGGFKDQEIRDIESRDLVSAFRFIDFVPHVGSIMKSVDAVLMPSLWEACGLVAMEAMVSGTPLIATDIPALNELCDGSPATLVPVRDGVALSKVLQTWDCDEQRRLARAYSEVAAERFSGVKAARGIRAIYEQYLDSSQATASSSDNQ